MAQEGGRRQDWRLRLVFVRSEASDGSHSTPDPLRLRESGRRWTLHQRHITGVEVYKDVA